MKPKLNNCEIEFYCKDYVDCVYHMDSEDEMYCKYLTMDWHCTSAVAQANALTLKLKKLTNK